MCAPRTPPLSGCWGRRQRGETHAAVTGIAKEHSGAYGLGISYAREMLGEHALEGGAAK